LSFFPGTDDETPFPRFKSFEEIKKKLVKLRFVEGETNSEEEERNDVYIYKTIKYLPKSTPSTTN